MCWIVSIGLASHQAPKSPHDAVREGAPSVGQPCRGVRGRVICLIANSPHARGSPGTRGARKPGQWRGMGHRLGGQQAAGLAHRQAAGRDDRPAVDRLPAHIGRAHAYHCADRVDDFSFRYARLETSAPAMDRTTTTPVRVCSEVVQARGVLPSQRAWSGDGSRARSTPSRAVGGRRPARAGARGLGITVLGRSGQR